MGFVSSLSLVSREVDLRRETLPPRSRFYQKEGSHSRKQINRYLLLIIISYAQPLHQKVLWLQVTKKKMLVKVGKVSTQTG